MGGSTAAWVEFLVVPMVGGAFALLLYIAIKPFFKRSRSAQGHLDAVAPGLMLHDPGRPRRICITVDFSGHDQRTVAAALGQGGKEADYVLIHITESAVARYIGPQADDREAIDDAANLQRYIDQLIAGGYRARARAGAGEVIGSIVDIVQAENADLLVMGAHGHRGIKDILLGSTLDAVRHRVKVPVLIVSVG
jgi:manganese transport protein